MSKRKGVRVKVKAIIVFPNATEGYNFSGRTLDLSLTGSDYIRVITRASAAPQPPSAGPVGLCVVAKSGAEFSSINSATGAAKCVGALVKVMPGEYVENVTVNKNQHLLGSGRGLTTIRAASDAYPAVVASGGSTVEGFSVVGGTNGVFASCSSCANVLIHVLNNDISGSSASAVAMTQYATGVVENNSIHKVHTGVNFYQFANTLLRDNEIYDVTIGAQLSYAKGVVNNNRIVTNGVSSSASLSLSYSTVSANFNTLSDNIVNQASTLVGKYNVAATVVAVGP